MPDLWYKGPNLAADTVVTRFNSRDNIFEVLVIQRKDSGRWALPGGFIEKGEAAETTAARELREEAGVDLSHVAGTEIYKGLVEDPRNTKESWVETTVFHKHVGTDVELNFSAGDDAAAIRWMRVTDEKLGSLNAGHGKFVRLAVASLR